MGGSVSFSVSVSLYHFLCLSLLCVCMCVTTLRYDVSIDDSRKAWRSKKNISCWSSTSTLLFTIVSTRPRNQASVFDFHLVWPWNYRCVLPCHFHESECISSCLQVIIHDPPPPKTKLLEAHP